MTTFLACTAALASPGMYGAAHLGSQPIEPGTAWAGTGGVALWLPSDGTGGVGLETGAAIGERFAFDVQVATDLEQVSGVPAGVAARYLVVDHPDVRVAATWTSFVFPVREGYELGDWNVFTAHSPGIALDAGGEKVRFDLALPIWGITSYDRYVGVARTPFPLYGTLGVDLLVSERSRLRFGLPELFSWSYRTEKVYFDLGGVTIFAAGAVWSKVGFVF